MRARPLTAACATLAALCACASSDEVPVAPEGWVEVYSQDFEGDRFGLDFVLSDPDAWRVGEEDDNRFLEQHAQSAYAPPHRSPLNVAVLAGPYLGDFVLEVDVMQTGREYDHRDACVFFAVQDPAHLAYAHLATAADENAHHVQLVAGGDRAPVTRRRSFGVDWGSGEWHRVRVEHSRSLERVRVYFDGGPDPVLVARAALSAGWIGLGTFDDSARFDNLVVYAPAYEVRSPAFFQPLGER
jgi:hypothetical protein